LARAPSEQRDMRWLSNSVTGGASKPDTPRGARAVRTALWACAAALCWPTGGGWTEGARDEDASYAVVVSASTLEDHAWRRVVDALVDRHSATAITYAEHVDEALGELRRVFPRYACFVAPPERIGQALVVEVNRLTRRLDDDPYGDVLWGIITGYSPEDALRIVRHQEPLTIQRAAAGFDIGLDAFREGVAYSETRQNVMWEKPAGGPCEERHCPGDTTRCLADEFNLNHPDLFATSGHATQHDWQIGYTYPNGQLRCQDGLLFGLDTAGRRYDINSPNPKVYSPIGNCLAGLIDGPDAIALAWMHTAGVHQMAGYVVPTWFGHLWGVHEYFVGGEGRYSYSESFFLDQQALLHQLQTSFPQWADLNVDTYTTEYLTQEFGPSHAISDDEALGLLWDRDAVAFYGDPAWDARVAPVRPPAWEAALHVDGTTFTLKVTTNLSGKWHRPPAAILPYRVANPRVLSGARLEPLITDDFVLLPLSGEHAEAEVYEVVFEAEPIG